MATLEGSSRTCGIRARWCRPDWPVGDHTVALSVIFRKAHFDQDSDISVQAARERANLLRIRALLPVDRTENLKLPRY